MNVSLEGWSFHGGLFSSTYYASSSYEVEVDGSDTSVRKTYSAGSTSIAVRTIVNGSTETLNWLLSDHLGSSSITTAADGTWNSEIRYSAFGETRYSSGITPTDYRYTGQLEQKDVNLYYYNARYYDAALGRFIQADTIIPSAGDSKSYDRYAYVSNNPLKFTDPSGHCYTGNGGWIPDGKPGKCAETPTTINTETNDSDNENNNDIEDIIKPKIRVYCGLGSWLACSYEDSMQMDKNTRQLYSGKYPMQPLTEMLRELGYEVILFDPNLVDVDGAVLPQNSPLSPNETYINVGFSAGVDGAIDEAVANPALVIKLILLDPPEKGQGLNLNYQGEVYIAYSDSIGVDPNNPIQHYFDPNIYQFENVGNDHPQLAVSPLVAQALVDYITGK